MPSFSGVDAQFPLRNRLDKTWCNNEQGKTMNTNWWSKALKGTHSLFHVVAGAMPSQSCRKRLGGLRAAFVSPAACSLRFHPRAETDGQNAEQAIRMTGAGASFEAVSEECGEFLCRLWANDHKSRTVPDKTWRRVLQETCNTETLALLKAWSSSLCEHRCCKPFGAKSILKRGTTWNNMEQPSMKQSTGWWIVLKPKGRRNWRLRDFWCDKHPPNYERVWSLVLRAQFF